VIREELSIPDRQLVDEFLSGEKSGVLSMVDEEGFPYSIPINYHYMNGSIYMHCSRKGRKIDLIEKSPKTQFTVFREYAFIPSHISGTNACSAGYFFASVMLFGETGFIDSVKEKTDMFSGMMRKYQPEGRHEPMSDMSVYKDRLEATSVFFLKPDRVTARFNFGQHFPEDRIEKIVSFLETRGCPGDIDTMKMIRRLRDKPE